MDLGLMKSSSQDQMEMLTAMMHLDYKLPPLSAPYNQDISILPPDMELSGGSTTSSDSSPPIFHNSPSSISFMGIPVQEAVNFALPKFSSPRGLVSSAQKSSSSSSSMEAMREMIFRIAMMQPIHIDPESVKPPKRRNVKISKDPQSVAARHRRERISERIRILQRLVPGGTKMDTASMLDEAVHYVKFLKKQVQSLEQVAANTHSRPIGVGFPVTMASTTTPTTTNTVNSSPFVKPCHPSQVMGSLQMLR